MISFVPPPGGSSQKYKKLEIPKTDPIPMNFNDSGSEPGALGRIQGGAGAGVLV